MPPPPPHPPNTCISNLVQAYASGLRRCLASIPLWRAAARLEEKAGAVGKARALLEQARLKNPKNDEAWLAGVRMELRTGNAKAAEALMAKALQVGGHAGAGALWSGDRDVRESCWLCTLPGSPSQGGLLLVVQQGSLSNAHVRDRPPACAGTRSCAAFGLNRWGRSCSCASGRAAAASHYRADIPAPGSLVCRVRMLAAK